MAKSVRVIGGKTVAHLPTTPSGTGEPGDFDPETGTFLRRPRPTTDDLRVGKRPANKKTAGIGAGSGSQEPL
jgi:hypothetical protein